MTVDFMKEEFGFTGRETVAIMGAHGFGKFHSGKGSLFPYTWTSYGESLMNNDFYRYGFMLVKLINKHQNICCCLVIIKLTSEIFFLFLKDNLQVLIDIHTIISLVTKSLMQKVTYQKLDGFLITRHSQKIMDHTSFFINTMDVQIA